MTSCGRSRAPALWDRLPCLQTKGNRWVRLRELRGRPPIGTVAEKEYFLLSIWLPGGDVRAVKIYLPDDIGCCDAYLGQPTVSLDNLGSARDFELAIPRCDFTLHIAS